MIALTGNAATHQALLMRGIDSLLLPPLTTLSDATAAHADLSCFALEGIVIAFPDIADQIRVQLAAHDISIISGTRTVRHPYPFDAAYNACCTGRYLIHRTDITEPAILAECERRGITIIPVRQGYARCSALPVDTESIITADEGIAAAAESAGLAVLRVSPGHIALEGYSHGFIGGAGGRIGGTVYFTGSLAEHPDRNTIERFIAERGLATAYLGSGISVDIGSILAA